MCDLLKLKKNIYEESMTEVTWSH